ncbi:MAG: bifunctional phosphopantothenoylcysteine decarboxylase/phosphopantothenate--cysteine ligase CoaBC [Alphaproteobacteria bacterium]
MNNTLKSKNILLVITGGIAAYKSLELIRLIRKDGGKVRCILTKGGAQFVTPLSVSALCEEEVYTDLWSLKDESEMGHIRLSREADAIIIAPASADFLAKMTHGMASDLATTTLLAADKPALIAPAMNHKMWGHPATQKNIDTLKSYGHSIIGPDEGDMACGEFGLGRMVEPENILTALKEFFFEKPLKGYKALVTSGPTYEPIDPVRFLGNRSSGKQGHAIAQALAEAGADVTLISGPVSLPAPPNVHTISVQTARDMLEACEDALPADIAICAAAVSDWAVQNPSADKIKKREDASPPTLDLHENPDILKTISTHANRPDLVIGFAAETNDLQANAKAKLDKKKCDWILANDVSDEKVFGQNTNHIHLINIKNSDDWGLMSKEAIARKLVNTIIEYYERKNPEFERHAAE